MHMKYFHQGIQQCWGSWDTAFLVQATKATGQRTPPRRLTAESPYAGAGSVRRDGRGPEI